VPGGKVLGAALDKAGYRLYCSQSDNLESFSCNDCPHA